MVGVVYHNYMCMLLFQDVVPCQKQSPESVLQQLLAREGCGHVVVCVSSREGGRRLSKHLSIFCWPAVLVGGGEERESMEELLEREAIPSELVDYWLIQLINS